tara:strand:+ start:240 stop:512 length:273 start_codon:yes stop_codon:yes gene_type:complete
MGRLQAVEMAGRLSVEESIKWHLNDNLYPPAPPSMVKPCLRAIDAFWENDLDREIQMPDGIFYRGEPSAPARDILISCHLDAWLDAGEED